MVNIVYDSRKIVSCGSRDDNVLSTCIDVSLSLVLAGVETGTLKNNVYSELTPRKVLSICFLVDGDLLSVYGNGILTESYLVTECVTSLCAVILKKMCEIATISNPSAPNICLNARRPIRPNPLIATFTAIFDSSW